jgi:uncharacterized protein YbjQ (UPF0145 family)
MIITTCDQVAGKNIVKTIGLVNGNTIRARHIGQDIVAGLRNIIGGEINEYTKLLADARDEAVGRMVKEAEKQGANAIVAVRLSTAEIMQGASEILAYGTAVVLE